MKISLDFGRVGEHKNKEENSYFNWVYLNNLIDVVTYGLFGGTEPAKQIVNFYDKNKIYGAEIYEPHMTKLVKDHCN